MTALSVVRRPIVFEVGASASMLADILARQEGVVGRASLYGITDPVIAKLFVSESTEADFAGGQYRRGFVSSASQSALPGWSFTRTGVATSETSGGGVVSFTSGTPRITDAGLMVEAAATNVILHSRDLTNAAWTKRNAVSVTVDAGQTRPDGTAGAVLIGNLSGGAGANDLFQALSVAPSQRFEPSIDIKRVSTTGIVSFQNPSGPGSWTIDLSLLPNAWARITRHHPAVTVVQEFVSAADGLCGLYFGNLGAGALSFHVDYAQLEAGTFSTSRIATTTAAATRGGEVAALSASTVSGGIFIEVDLPAFAPAATQHLFSWSNGTDQTLLLYRDAANALVLVAAKPDGEISRFVTGFAGARRVKAFVGWGDGELVWNIDGVERSAAPLAFPLTVNSIRLGSDFFGGDNLDGLVRRALFVSRLPTLAQRSAMTAA